MVKKKMQFEGAIADAAAALEKMGYSKHEADRAVESVSITPGMDAGKILLLAMKYFKPKAGPQDRPAPEKPQATAQTPPQAKEEPQPKPADLPDPQKLLRVKVETALKKLKGDGWAEAAIKDALNHEGTIDPATPTNDIYRNLSTWLSASWIGEDGVHPGPPKADGGSKNTPAKSKKNPVAPKADGAKPPAKANPKKNEKEERFGEKAGNTGGMLSRIGKSLKHQYEDDGRYNDDLKDEDASKGHKRVRTMLDVLTGGNSLAMRTYDHLTSKKKPELEDEEDLEKAEPVKEPFSKMLDAPDEQDTVGGKGSTALLGQILNKLDEIKEALLGMGGKSVPGLKAPENEPKKIEGPKREEPKLIEAPKGTEPKLLEAPKGTEPKLLEAPKAEKKAEHADIEDAEFTMHSAPKKESKPEAVLKTGHDAIDATAAAPKPESVKPHAPVWPKKTGVPGFNPSVRQTVPAANQKRYTIPADRLEPLRSVSKSMSGLPGMHRPGPTTVAPRQGGFIGAVSRAGQTIDKIQNNGGVVGMARDALVKKFTKPKEERETEAKPARSSRGLLKTAKDLWKNRKLPETVVNPKVPQAVRAGVPKPGPKAAPQMPGVKGMPRGAPVSYQGSPPVVPGGAKVPPKVGIPPVPGPAAAEAAGAGEGMLAGAGRLIGGAVTAGGLATAGAVVAGVTGAAALGQALVGSDGILRGGGGKNFAGDAYRAVTGADEKDAAQQARRDKNFNVKASEFNDVGEYNAHAKASGLMELDEKGFKNVVRQEKLTEARVIKDSPQAQKNASELMPHLDKELEAQGVASTPDQKAMAIGQISHETGGFSKVGKEGNYSAKRVWELRGKELEKQGVKKEDVELSEKLGGDSAARMDEYMYSDKFRSDKNKLGNTEKGDATKYKGRGALQITGKTNYEKAGKDLGLDLVNHPELAEAPENSAKLAAWHMKNSPKAMEGLKTGDIDKLSQGVNGGQYGKSNGRQDRIAKTLAAQTQLASLEKTETPVNATNLEGRTLEVAAAKQQSIIVQASAPQQDQTRTMVSSGAGTAKANPPMITTNPDSSIAAITRAQMGYGIA